MVRNQLAADCAPCSYFERRRDRSTSTLPASNARPAEIDPGLISGTPGVVGEDANASVATACNANTAANPTANTFALMYPPVN
jgi:hypothetical protein